MTNEVSDKALDHLLRRDGQEDICFALWYPSQGTNRTTALIQEIVLPLDGERIVHGNVEFLPLYFERVLDLAATNECGVALLHSHCGPGWQGMSADDITAENGHAAAVKGATGLPLLGLTAGTDRAWSARFWEKTAPRVYERRWCESVRVVGGKMTMTYHDDQLPKPGFRPELERTLSAWGEKAQADLARLRVGIVGAGSVGSMVAESLARMGVKHLTLLDFDGIEIVNLDRHLHGRRIHVAQRLAKTQVVADAIRESATADGFSVSALEHSVCEEDGYRAALDCDVLFSCVDRPWPRSVLNFIAYAHLIPVVDGGIQVQAKNGATALRSADWRAHIAAPGRRCLECLGQFTSDLVALETTGQLDDPSYIVNLPMDHPARRTRQNQNVFAFSMAVASLEVLQFLSMLVAPKDFANVGAQMYHFIQGSMDMDYRGCQPNCYYCGLTARGDRTGIAMVGEHTVAVEAREQRRNFLADLEQDAKPTLRRRGLFTWISGLFRRGR